VELLAMVFREQLDKGERVRLYIWVGRLTNSFASLLLATLLMMHLHWLVNTMLVATYR